LLMEDPNDLPPVDFTHWDVHFYFDEHNPEDVKSALEVWRASKKNFPRMPIFEPVPYPIGPHPIGMWEAHFISNGTPRRNIRAQKNSSRPEGEANYGICPTRRGGQILFKICTTRRGGQISGPNGPARSSIPELLARVQLFLSEHSLF